MWKRRGRAVRVERSSWRSVIIIIIRDSPKVEPPVATVGSASFCRSMGSLLPPRDSAMRNRVYTPKVETGGGRGVFSSSANDTLLLPATATMLFASLPFLRSLWKSSFSHMDFPLGERFVLYKQNSTTRMIWLKSCSFVCLISRIYSILMMIIIYWFKGIGDMFGVNFSETVFYNAVSSLR